MEKQGPIDGHMNWQRLFRLGLRTLVKTFAEHEIKLGICFEGCREISAPSTKMRLRVKPIEYLTSVSDRRLPNMSLFAHIRWSLMLDNALSH